MRAVAHARAPIDARNEFWAGWATARGFAPPWRAAGWSGAARERPLWRAVKFAEVDWAIKPYLGGYASHDPAVAAAERAARAALEEAAARGDNPGQAEQRVKAAIGAAAAAVEAAATALDDVGTAAVDAALDAAAAGAVVAGSIASAAADAGFDAANRAGAIAGAAALDMTDAAVEALAARSRHPSRPSNDHSPDHSP